MGTKRTLIDGVRQRVEEAREWLEAVLPWVGEGWREAIDEILSLLDVARLRDAKLKLVATLAVAYEEWGGEGTVIDYLQRAVVALGGWV